ncbi:unnamed protein product [Leptosia nina]|uniref:Uncharacterized protein n=1 Tax=Leptosia nina TaxID=320188 RepID=A0AAV1J3A2_9NEOP
MQFLLFLQEQEYLNPPRPILPLLEKIIRQMEEGPAPMPPVLRAAPAEAVTRPALLVVRKIVVNQSFLAPRCHKYVYCNIQRDESLSYV